MRRATYLAGAGGSEMRGTRLKIWGAPRIWRMLVDPDYVARGAK